jgi:outer membrane protein assembly factor BamB
MSGLLAWATWRGATALITTVAASTAVVAMAAGAGSAAARPVSPQAVSTDWPAYLDGPLHTSYASSQTTITPRSTGKLVQAWHYGSGVNFLSSATIADGAVFIGSDAGWFYKLSESTGAVLARRFIGYQPAKTCGALGTVSTATVATDPASHRATVYVAGADGYLYALDAAHLAVRWKSVIDLPSATVSDYFDWSSPTVANGRIYVGVSSECDKPLVRGGLIAYSQATGAKLAEFYTVPAGDVGGSIWSSAAVAANGDVFASTGNGPPDDQLLGYSESIVKLDPRTLRVLGRFQVPAAQIGLDSDFGGSPLVFGAYVGSCDKDGIFYLVSQASMRLRWDRRIGDASYKGTTGQCIATPAYDGSYLYFGGNQTVVKGVTYLGSVQARKPGSGQLVWQTPLADGVTGSPSIDRGGVLAVPAYYPPAKTTPNALYLINPKSGRILRVLAHGTEFAQAVFAGGWLFSADNDGVYAWHLGR